VIRILGTAVLVSLLSPDSAPLPQGVRWVMGTHLRVVLADPDLPAAVAEEILREVFDSVERDNALLSHWDPETPLSRLNQRAGDWVEIPDDLCAYLRRSRSDARRTGGLFDLTVGPSLRDPTLRTGIRHLDLDCASDPARARLRYADLALDPGGSGKGWALDRAVDLLRARGVRNALLEFGGSSWFGLGRPPEGDAWRVTLTDPAGGVVGVARLVDQALSTSAAWRRAGDGEGEEVHIVDPRTRRPVETRRVATVVSSSATDAEVLSTALVVAGRDGLQLLEAYPGSDAVVVEPGAIHPDGGRPWWSPAP